MNRVLKLHPKDNVIVALQNLKANEIIDFEGVSYTIQHDIEAKHKFVTEDLAIGDSVMMYGVLVGKASQPIKKGSQITTFNLKHDSEEYSTAKRQPYSWTPPNVDKWKDRTFMGYHRSDGSVGTRNFWLVIPLVFCENRNIMIMKDAFERELGYAQPEIYRNQVHELVERFRNSEILKFRDSEGLNSEILKFHDSEGLNSGILKFRDSEDSNSESQSLRIPESQNPRIPESQNLRIMESQNQKIPESQNLRISESKNQRIFPNVDGIKFLTHEGGCGGTRQDATTLCNLFAAYANNPNVAGITILSLGCQNAEYQIFADAVKARNPNFDKPILFFEQQKGTEFELLSDAIQETFLGLIEANKIERKPASISKLNVGLKCGGSDGFSGISANPALGYLSDILVSVGGRTLLAEFPELHGVEQELINRCESEEKAAKFEKLMRDYSSKATAAGSAFAFNPSPGNIKDGLITDAIKSAGAARKGGNAPIVDVLNYTELPTKQGLHLVCTPGNDVEAVTGKAASGATITLFTTGLGTPTGNPICPVVKVSTNNTLAAKMHDVIDFNSGSIISGEETIAQNAEKMLDWIIGLASGEYVTHAERLGQDDFIPWKRGVSL
jgi:altronate hydrolase